MLKYSFILFLFLTACQNQSNKPPIDQNTYKSILKEMILTHIVSQEIKNDSVEKPLRHLVYKKYHVDSLTVQQTTAYYSQHPEALLKIYEEIYQELKQISDSLEKEKPISKPDSQKTGVKISKKQVPELKSILKGPKKVQ
jgi:hypothetical protein